MANLPSQHDTDSQSAAEATATIAAITNKQWAITAVSASYSTTDDGLLQIKDGSTVIWSAHVYDSKDIKFPDGLAATRGNAVSAVLAAGTNIGYVNIAARVV